MILYTVTWTERKTPYNFPRTYREWHGTMAAANKAAKARDSAAVAQVDVPTAKPELITWLNANTNVAVVHTK